MLFGRAAAAAPLLLVAWDVEGGFRSVAIRESFRKERMSTSSRGVFSPDPEPFDAVVAWYVAAWDLSGAKRLARMEFVRLVPSFRIDSLLDRDLIEYVLLSAFGVEYGL